MKYNVLNRTNNDIARQYIVTGDICCC